MKMRKGFTLIEFVVIISIFAIMASVALFNFKGFQNNVAINNVAHDIALVIRQAQVFGWATQTDTLNDSIQLDPNTKNPLRYPSGVYFPYTNGFDESFILYKKVGQTDPAFANYQTTDQLIDTILLQGTSRIVAIGYGETVADVALNDDRELHSGIARISEGFSVAFSRPYPEAMFFTDSGALNTQYVAIYVASENNTNPNYIDRMITISRFGEIEVE